MRIYAGIRRRRGLPGCAAGDFPGYMENRPEYSLPIGADTLGYLPAGELCTLAGKDVYCHACFTGTYPTAIPADTRKDRFERRLSE